MDALRDFAHFDRLFYASVLATGTEFPVDPDIINDDYLRLPTRRVVGLAFTAPGRTLDIRPYDQYYQRLVMVLGEPVWMKDSLPKRMWAVHALKYYQ